MIRYGLKSLDINYIVERDNLKKYFLYFDKLYFDAESFKMSERVGQPLTEMFYKHLDFKEQIRLKSSEIEYLINEGLLIEFKNRDLEKEAYNRKYIDFIKHFDKFKDSGVAFFTSVDTMHLASVIRTTQNLIYGLEGNPNDAYQCYFNSVLLGRLNNVNVTPIFEDFTNNSQDNKGIEEKTLSFVLKNLPTIDDSTSWEQVLDFKNDDDVKLSFQRLRNWMIDVSKTNNLTQNEIVEKYEYLYNEYKSFMSRHKVKTTKGIIKTVVFTAAETIENLATFKWSKLAKDLFSIIDSKMRLAELQSNAPGKEVGFVYKANEKFKNNNR